MSFVIDKFKSKNGASVSEEFAFVQWDISDLPVVQNKDYQYLIKSSKYLEVELKASMISV